MLLRSRYAPPRQATTPTPLKEAIKNIDTQTQEFAARRMDQSVRIALKGQSVDEV